MCVCVRAWPVLFRLPCVHTITLKKKTKCETIPADWHQTGTSRRGRRSSRSASAAENRCSCLEDNPASGPREPSAAPCTPSQSRLHPSPPVMQTHYYYFLMQSCCKMTMCVCVYHNKFTCTTLNQCRFICPPLRGRRGRGCAVRCVVFSRRTLESPKTWQFCPSNWASLSSPPETGCMKRQDFFLV